MAYKYKGGYIAIVKDPAGGIQRLADLRKHYDGMTYTQYKKQFNEVVTPKYRELLKQYGIQEAEKISRTGELAGNVVTGRGKATRGYPSVWLGAEGRAAKYASIINEGGWQHKDEKYLTIPLDATKDPTTGARTKTTYDFPSDKTFLWTPTNPTWGRLVGQLVLFLKEKNSAPVGRIKGNLGNPVFKRGKGTKGVHFHKITPLFIYAESNYVNATHWATNAMKRSRTDAIKMIREYNKNFPKRGATSK